MRRAQPPRRILALSSQVAYGHVGLSAAVPVLQQLGCAVTALPTILLSNHPGWPHVSGRQVPVTELDAMIDALDANGWLSTHDTILTGYLPSPDHVALAARLIDRMRDRVEGLRAVVDPVLGDAPKGLYINEGAATAIRSDLVARADVLTPNAFELSWLTGLPTDAIVATAAAARILPCHVLTTSAPAGPGRTGVLDTTPDTAILVDMPLRDSVPNGVGDVFSALVAAGDETGQALGRLKTLIEASLGADHLRIVEAAGAWTIADPL